MANFTVTILPLVLTVVFLLHKSSVEGLEENGIRENLEYIIHHPLNRDRPASLLLGAPLTLEKIALTLLPVIENIDATHLKQLVNLYLVTDGLKSSEMDGTLLKDRWILPGYYMLSLNEAKETLEEIRQASDVWRSTWFPLMSSGAGDFIVFDSKDGSIYEIFLKESLGWKVATDLQEFLHMSARMFESGIIFMDENGMLEESMPGDGKHLEGHTSGGGSRKPSPPRGDEMIAMFQFDLDTDNVSVSISQWQSVKAIPGLVFNCTPMRRVCLNIRRAIRGGKTRKLNRITSKAQIKANRRKACGKLVCKKPNDSCDEYPFASTAQGGSGATILCVPLKENLSQGGQLSNFYKKYKIANNGRYDMKKP